MDALGCRSLMRAPPDGGVHYRLVGVGAPDAGYRNADAAVSCCQYGAFCRGALSGRHRVETACSQPDDTGRDPRQCCLLPHPSDGRSASCVTRPLHGYASLFAILLVGVRGGVARRCAKALSVGGAPVRHSPHAGRLSGCAMAGRAEGGIADQCGLGKKRWSHLQWDRWETDWRHGPMGHIGCRHGDTTRPFWNDHENDV